MIRPYRGLGDAMAALERVPDARLLVAGDPVEPVDAYRARDGERVEWRLGYLPDAEVDRALGEATLALFPYRPGDSTSPASLLRALGAGVPAVVYDVGGLAEPVARFGAGRVVPAGDVDGLAAARAGAARRSGSARGGAGRRAAGAGGADLGRVRTRAPRRLRRVVR